MGSTKKYYVYLDVLRIVSCIAIFLYHLDILKGGYLAVCSFFVLSGYLSYISASKKEKFSLLSYYKNRFIHIYMPFVIVIFLSVAAIHFLPIINWLNLKPETMSALFGYNNFWQLKANLDYFARHVDSPFMHFWYMGILLQFELVFPFVFLLLKTIKNKIHKSIPCILLGILTVIGTFYFGYMCVTESNRMIVYYHTLTRLFSLFFGMFIASIHTTYHNLSIKRIDARIPFFFYLLLFILACFFIGADSTYFMIGMILVSVITGRLITYGTLYQSSMSIGNSIIQYLAKISYEVYLFQYPVIVIMQYVLLKNAIRIPVIIVSTIICSMALHFLLEKRQSGKRLIFQILLFSPVTLFTIFGIYQFIVAEDHTEEMNQLADQLNQNEKMMESKQEEYAKKLKEEEEKLKNALAEIDTSAAGLGEYIHNLPVIGVGDSVMLGAFPSLYEQFPKGYFDAKVSRTDYEANQILVNIKQQGFLGDPIVISLGTNGQCGIRCQEVILQTVENRKVFWINVVNDAEVHVNAGLKRLADSHANVTLVDWDTISDGHPEYFVADGIHLTGSGRMAYAQALYDAIYKVYEQDIAAKKEQLLKEHENALNNKISFYGNDVLLNSYSFMQKQFSEYELDFHAKQEQSTDDIIKEIVEASKSNSFAKHIVFLLDTTMNLTKKQFQELEKLSSTIYLVSIGPISYTSTEKVIVIDFSKEIHSHNDYLMVDKAHLTEKGNEALAEQLLKEMTK